MKAVSRNVGTKGLDLSLLQPTEFPSTAFQRMDMGVGSNAVSAGLQQLADRFTLILFTPSGSLGHDKRFGTDLLKNLVIGSSLDFGAVQTAAALAVLQAERQILDEDGLENSPYTDAHGDDARLDSAVCTDVSYEPSSGTLKLYVSLTNKAGESYTYILPANLEILT